MRCMERVSFGEKPYIKAPLAKAEIIKQPDYSKDPQ